MPAETQSSPLSPPSPSPSVPSSWLIDWFGVGVLFLMWVGLLLLTIHEVVIPRTVSQHWPSWLPLIGGVGSYLAEGLPDTIETSFALPRGEVGLAMGLVGLAASPLLISFGAALIAKWQQAPRVQHRFEPQIERDDGNWTEREKRWKAETANHICQLWTIEAKRALQAQHRMMQHASLFGLSVSTVMSWSVILNNSTTVSCQVRMMAIAAASAAVASFALSFGRISVRASIRDTSARMFAYALRGVITAVLATMLMCSLLWHNHVTTEVGNTGKDHSVLSEQPLKSPTSFLMMGILIALIGESVLGQLTNRAASTMNLSVSKPSDNVRSSLDSIEGLSEQDVLRLGEEGIDSLHALALASIPYLYFSTPYTLQRLCDWQDQALLIAKVGFAMAQSCREKLMIRGCTALQRKADFLVSELGSSDSDGKTPSPHQKTFEIIRSSLGFTSVELARESLFPLAHDEAVRRLRVYERGAVVAPDDGAEV